MTPLVSKKRLLRFVPLQEGDTRFDDVLETLVQAVSEVVQEFLGSSLEEAPIVEKLPSYQVPDNCFLYLWLKSVPVDESTFVLEYRNRAGDYVVLESSAYDLMADDGLVVVHPSTSYSDNPVGFRVSYTGGYEVTETFRWNYVMVPAAIATATAIQTAYVFNLYSRGSFGIESLSGDDTKARKSSLDYNKADPLIPEVQAMLKLFVRPKGLVG